MGGVRITLDASGDLVTVAREVTRTVESLSATVAEAIAPQVVEAMTADVVGRRGSMTLSGFKGGVLLTLTPFVKTSETVSSVTIGAQPASLWRGIDYGFKKHEITTTRFRGMPTSRGILGRVNHPGTRGGRYFDHAASAADAMIGPVAEQILTGQLGG